MSAAPLPRREDLPDGSVRIHFAAPILLHDQPKGFVTLRQPTPAEFWEHGDPRELMVSQDGLGTAYTDRKALVGWIGRLMIDHDADMIGRDRDLALGMLIEEAVLDFFATARTRSKAASAPSPKPD